MDTLEIIGTIRDVIVITFGVAALCLFFIIYRFISKLQKALELALKTLKAMENSSLETFLKPLTSPFTFYSGIRKVYKMINSLFSKK